MDITIYIYICIYNIFIYIFITYKISLSLSLYIYIYISTCLRPSRHRAQLGIGDWGTWDWGLVIGDSAWMADCRMAKSTKWLPGGPKYRPRGPEYLQKGTQVPDQIPPKEGPVTSKTVSG